MFRFKLFFVTFTAVLLSVTIQAQSARDIANLMQDVELMKQHINQLTYDVQTLQRSNQSLLNTVAELKAERQDIALQVTTLAASTDGKLNALREQLLKASNQQKEQIISSVAEQIESYVADTQRAFEQLQKSAAPNDTTEAPGVKTNFGTDFPKSGVEYTVKKGDSLWKIAQELNSKTSWIQDANRISNPTQIKVGQVLFIPQKP